MVPQVLFNDTNYFFKRFRGLVLQRIIFSPNVFCSGEVPRLYVLDHHTRNLHNYLKFFAGIYFRYPVISLVNTGTAFCNPHLPYLYWLNGIRYGLPIAIVNRTNELCNIGFKKVDSTNMQIYIVPS